MIARLRGRVAEREKAGLVLDVNGIGLRALVPAPLLARVGVGEPLALFTYLHVRENELTLYGFGSADELALFEVLLTVSGVGPKVALSLLSAMSPDALRRAIGHEQPELLARIPGIGKRTAEKIVFELKAKMPLGETAPGLAALAEADSEVITALTGLGYSIVEAQRAIQAVPSDVTAVEERLRLALAQFARL